MWETIHGEDKLSDEFPTVFGRSIATSVDLLDKSETGVEFLKQNYALGQFQQMSCACPFERAILIYHGIELTEEQTEALKLIHETTKDWLKSYAIAEIMARLKNKKTGNRDFAESIKYIFDSFTEDDKSTDVGKPGKKKLVVQITSAGVKELKEVKKKCSKD